MQINEGWWVRKLELGTLPNDVRRNLAVLCLHVDTGVKTSKRKRCVKHRFSAPGVQVQKRADNAALG